MTLSTHAFIGAAITTALPEHVYAGVAIAFASHFVLDAIPHWDYKILSACANPENPSPFAINKAFCFDLVRIGTDFALGALLAFYFYQSSLPWLWFLGFIAATLPDFLQFVYSKYPRGILALLQKFHVWIHTDIRLKNAFLGVTSQMAFVGFVAMFVHYFNF